MARLLVGEVEAIAGMDDRMTPALQGLRGQLGDFSRKAGVAMGAASAYALAAGAEFEKSRQTIAEGTGATGEALEGLTDSFRNLAGTIPGIANPEVAAAIADLNTHMGLTGTALEDVAAKALKARVDTNTFGGVVKQMGLDSAGASALLDDLTAASQKTGVGVDELVGRAGKLSARWIQAKGDTEGLIETVVQAADEFGPAGLRGALAEIGTELDQGTIPSFQSLDAQLGETAGAVERTHQAGITFTEQLGAMKDRAAALIGPFGSVAGGVGSIASAAALAGPQIVSLGTSIGTKLLPFLAGPAGLVLLVGAAAAAFVSLRTEAENLDKQFAHINEKTQLREEIERLEAELLDAEAAAERATERMGTFGTVTSDVAEARVVGLRYSLRQAKERFEELNLVVTGGTEGGTTAVGGSVGSLLSVAGVSEKASTKMYGLVTSIDEAELAFGRLTESQIMWREGLIRDIEKVSDSEVWAGIGTSAAKGVEGGFIAAGPALTNAFRTKGASLGGDISSALTDAIGSALPGPLTALITGLAGSLASTLAGTIIGSITSAFTGARYTLEGTQQRFPGAGQGGGPPAPEEEFREDWQEGQPQTGGDARPRPTPGAPSPPAPAPIIVRPPPVILDGQDIARSSRRHMPDIADQEGW